MIIIADSGSTKCDWLVLNEDLEIVDHVKTMGLNPYFHNDLFISNILVKNASLNEIQESVTEIHFYGAGCSTQFYNDVMERGLQNVFPNAKINVDHDLMACALASYDGEAAISCILGTGSNSCFFDGKKITSGHPSMGYIVGDEASGSYFGKILLHAYFLKLLPEDLSLEFKKTYNLSHLEFSQSVYGTKNANVFLASYMRFISENKEHPYFQKMMKDGFRVFMQNHVTCFENYKEVKVNFVGSIGFYFQEEIISVAKEFDITVGEFVQKPIFNLVTYHKEKAVKN